jgi:hypothetical protein
MESAHNEPAEVQAVSADRSGGDGLSESVPFMTQRLGHPGISSAPDRVDRARRSLASVGCAGSRGLVTGRQVVRPAPGDGERLGHNVGGVVGGVATP